MSCVVLCFFAVGRHPAASTWNCRRCSRCYPHKAGVAWTAPTQTTQPHPPFCSPEQEGPARSRSGPGEQAPGAHGDQEPRGCSPGLVPVVTKLLCDFWTSYLSAWACFSICKMNEQTEQPFQTSSGKSWAHFIPPSVTIPVSEALRLRQCRTRSHLFTFHSSFKPGTIAIIPMVNTRKPPKAHRQEGVASALTPESTPSPPEHDGKFTLKCWDCSSGL